MEVTQAEFEASRSQPIDCPFLSLAERQEAADSEHTPRLPHREPAHTTKDEIEFIAGLETNKIGTLNNKLLGYLDGCEKRVRWGYIDKEKAMSAAAARLVEATEATPA